MALRAAGCVFAEEEAQLLIEAAATAAELHAMVARRVSGLPLEHILGWAEFCGLQVAVDPGVFVPRRRTEFLARTAIALARDGATSAAPVVLDLCCGSGAVGAAVEAALPGARVVATDIDPAAARCARRNIRGEVLEGDLFAPLLPALRGRIDVIAANAPYVPTDSIGMMPPEARLHEARVALDGGTDGLDVQRRVIAEVSAWLAPGGHLLIETSRAQSELLRDLFERAGLSATIDADAALDATIVVGVFARRSQ